MFDLHTHTTASDGTLTPSALVSLCRQEGIRHLGITDHDTLGGIQEALDASRGSAVVVVPGIELSIDDDRDEIHILGYFVDHHNKPLLDTLIRLQSGRSGRLDRILAKLDHLGISLSRATVENLSTGESIGRPHLAQAMVNAGIVKNREDAFDKYLKKGAPGYVPRERLSIYEAVSLIRNAGGMPVLAHPGFIQSFTEIFNQLLDAGIMGIEAHYPSHTPLQTQHFIDLAQRHGLAITAGSDFHGPKINGLNSPGCPGVPAEVIENFLAFHNRVKS
jgi:hypothetical protein